MIASRKAHGADELGGSCINAPQRRSIAACAAAAYLHPAITRPNLKVITDALATRILFDGERATGVEIARNGLLEEVQAGSEVIVAAGALNSPQLLLLSGIGPADELAALQISVRHDLPVGIGLQDHPMAFMSWRTDTETLMTSATAENAALLQSEGRGPLSSNIAEAGGILSHTRGARSTRRAVPRHPRDDLGSRLDGSDGACRFLRPVRAEADQPWQSLASHCQSGIQTEDHAQLFCERGNREA